MKIQLTFSQCKQISANTDLREFVEQINDQPDFMAGVMSIDSIGELQSIIQSGCAANAHRSVYYYDAAQCMAEHGDDVLDYIKDSYGELPDVSECSWGEMAIVYLSLAIELWCGQFSETLDNVDWD